MPNCNLTFEDLWQSCQTCNGNGKIPSHREGSALVSASNCEDCGGRGGKPTPTGQAIIDLIRRNEGHRPVVG